MTRWGFPLLRALGLMPQPPAAVPPSAPAVVTPIVANGNGISDTVELTEEEEQVLEEAKTPEVAGTAITENGIEATILHHPIEKYYTVQFPPGYETYNKGKWAGFKTYEEAEFYVVDVVSARIEAAAEPSPYRTGIIPYEPPTPLEPLPPRDGHITSLSRREGRHF